MADGAVGDPNDIGAGDGPLHEVVASALVEAAPHGVLMTDALMATSDGWAAAGQDRLPIARSKFGVPVVPAGCVARPRLAGMLAGGDWRVALVNAGPASGKTVAVAQWFEALEVPARQWVSLDAADDQPERFWLTLAVVLERAAPGGFEGAIGLAGKSGRAPESFLDRLLVELSAIEHPLALVLDDVHVLRNPAIAEGLTSMVERLPPGVRLLLTSRVDPPVPLARWRGRSWHAEYPPSRPARPRQ